MGVKVLQVSLFQNLTIYCLQRDVAVAKSLNSCHCV